MYAIDSLCPENVKTLLESYDKSKINVKFEDRNCLHLLMNIFDNSSKKNEFRNIGDCIKILLAAGCDPNSPDIDSKTPFFLLLRVKARLDADLHKDLVEYFMHNAIIDVHTYRSDEMIQMMRIQNLQIPEKIEKIVNADYLRHLLEISCDNEFIKHFRDFKDRFANVSDHEQDQNDVTTSTCSDVEDTAMLVSSKASGRNEAESLSDAYVENCAAFLVEATKNGMTNVVELLLSEGVDVNRFPKFERPAGFIACSRGYHEILELLLNHTNSARVYDLEVNYKQKNLLHEVCSHFGMESELDDNQNYQKCFDLLMSCSEIEINQQDELGLTPIYYAIRYKNDDATKALLRRCYVGKRNMFNKAQIYHIGKEVFEEFLDECITLDVHEQSGEQRISVDFRFLVSPKKTGQEFFEEIAPLEEIANNSELRPLILHPVLSSFLYLKWIKLSILFYTNLLFFFFFMGSFTTYIVLYKSDIFFIFSVVSLLLMMIKEVMQCYLSYKSYFRSHMNWFELTLIVLIWIVLLDNQFQSVHDSLEQIVGIKTIRIIRAVTILCATYEFLILFGDLPNFSVSTHMVILKRVFITFLKSIALYSILLLGFAFCFYTLFGSNGDESAESGSNGTKEDDEDFHHFKYPGFAIIKTIVMFSGELEASSIDLKNNDAVYSLIFLLFVFLITIVLLNLINGLSVSDVFQIKAEGHLVDLCQKIHVLNKYERIIMSRTDSFRCLKSIISIFPEFVQQSKIEIDRNHKVKLGSSISVPQESFAEQFYNFLLKNVIKFDSVLKYARKKDENKQKPQADGFFIRIDSNIMKKIKTVLEQRGEKKTEKDQAGRIAEIETKLKLLNKIDDKLESILNALKEQAY